MSFHCRWHTSQHLQSDRTRPIHTPWLTLSHILDDPVSKALLPRISIPFHQPGPSSQDHVQLYAESRDEDGAQHDRVTPEEGAKIDG